MMGWIPAVDDVAQRSAIRNFEAEVMITVDVLAEQMALPRCLDTPQIQWKISGQRSVDQRLRIAGRLDLGRVVSRLFGRSQRRQRFHPAALLQLPQEQKAFPAFETAVGPSPVEQFADCARQLSLA